MKILIVEDDLAVAESLRILFSTYHYAVDLVSDSANALAMTDAFGYDLILLDVLLPDGNGVDLCQHLRSQGLQCPILLLTGQGNSQTKVAALNVGADDYITKPFNSAELIARVQALLRRGELNHTSTLAFDGLSMDPSSHRVAYRDQLLTLSPKAYAILELLLRNPEKSFNSEAILSHVWTSLDIPGEETVRVHIKDLRQKLTALGAPKDLIKTQHRRGYRLNPLYATTLSSSMIDRLTPPQIAELNATNAALRSTQAELEQQVNYLTTKLNQRDTQHRIELTHTEIALRHNQEMFSELVRNAPFGIYLIDAEFRLQQINRGAEAVFSNIDPLIGRDFSEILRIIWPEAFATEALNRFHHTFDTGESYYSPVIVEQRANIDEIQSYDWQIHRITLPDGSYGVVCYFYDLSEIKQAEEIIRRAAQRNAFLVALSDAMRPIADPVELQAIVTRILGEYLGANRVLYFEICGSDYIVERDYVNGVTPLNGRYPIDSFSAKVLEAHRAGRTAAVSDLAADPDLAPAQKAAYAAIQIAAHLDIPLVKGGEFVAGLAIHASEPREWTLDEITLSEEVAERTWAAVERARAELTLQQQIRQEYLLADIAQEIRQSLDLNQVLSRTVHRVRDLLNTDRVIFFRFRPDWSGEVIMESVGAAWRPILSTNITDPCFNDRYIEPYRQGHISAIADVDRENLQPCHIDLLKSFQIRANLVVPILVNDTLWGLLIAHHCAAPREWQAAEIALLQRLSTQVSIAIQQAELYQNLQTELIERQQAEQKIREQAALLDISSDAICVRDLEHRIRYWNRGAERLYGWTAAEAIGQKATELLQENEVQVAEIYQTVLTIGEWQGEIHKFNRTGQELIIQGRWTLVRDEAGQPKFILTVNTDITEKKNLEAQFYHAQRLESLGTLASGIAHDLNNVLTPIVTLSQLLRLHQSDMDERSQHMLKLLEDSSKRGADVVKQILAFNRGTAGERRPVEVACVVQEVVDVARQTFPKSIDIYLATIDPHLWLVSVDPTYLHQILMNLCVNARDAMPDGGLLTLAAENFQADYQFTQTHLQAHVGNYVMITLVC